MMTVNLWLLKAAMALNPLRDWMINQCYVNIFQWRLRRSKTHTRRTRWLWCDHSGGVILHDKAGGYHKCILTNLTCLEGAGWTTGRRIIILYRIWVFRCVFASLEEGLCVGESVYPSAHHEDESFTLRALYVILIKSQLKWIPEIYGSCTCTCIWVHSILLYRQCSLNDFMEEIYVHSFIDRICWFLVE